MKNLCFELQTVHTLTILLGLFFLCLKTQKPNKSSKSQKKLFVWLERREERLPTTQNMSPGMEPLISKTLMAALKRAQAPQHWGCPKQQQQPLLAVKVKLEQLIISILDDPSVSRVMREASFSSPALKTTIEQSLNSSSTPSAAAANSSSIGLGFRPSAMQVMGGTRNLYLNTRLQQQGSGAQLGQLRVEDVKRVVDILLRTKKGNLVLVGESKPEELLL